MMEKMILVIFVIFFPALVLYLEKKSRIIKTISPIVICYIVGIILANIPHLELDKALLTQIYEISISLAIPLLLFNSNVVDWIKHSGKSILSYMLSVVAVIVSSIIFYYVFRDSVPDAWKISGMLVGVYTGGTPNMSAIGIAFDTPQEVYIILNSSDVVLGSLYFIILITFLRRFLGLFMPGYQFAREANQTDGSESLPKISKGKLFFNIVSVLLLGVIILGLAAWISIAIKGKVAGPLVIMILTTFGIGVSFIKKIQKLKGSFETAFYLLLIFSLSIGALADVKELLNRSSDLFMYTALVMFCSIALHIIMAALFRIDRDTLIITSTAAIYGPAFIGPVANAIKNRDLILSGIAMGLLGYAIGNYIGIGIGMILN